ncbi:MAG: sugar phosphate nucleotidyltransferase [Promethearchaeota archaeon]
MTSKSSTFVIILAAGKATRLRPLSERIPKPLIKINKIPIILRIIESFKKAGYSKFCIIIGYKGNLIKQEVSKINNIELEFVEQKELLGMADALFLSIKYLKKKYKDIQNFFITASDIIFSNRELINIEKLYNNIKADMVLSLMRSKDITIAQGHGNVKIFRESNYLNGKAIERGFKIIDIIEKPKKTEILSEYYSLPLYLIKKKVFSYLKKVTFSERGEKEFQDAIKIAINNGDNIRGINIIPSLITNENIGEFHLTYLKDIIKMSKRFMLGTNINKNILRQFKFFSPLEIGSNFQIGKNSILGPYLIIGNDCKIGNNCRISNSIIYNNAKFGHFCEIEWCIIDENVILPDDFKAINSFIMRDKYNNIKIINF